MSGDAARLLRLSKALSQAAAALEMRLLAQKQHLRERTAEEKDLGDCLSRLSASSLASLSAGVDRLVRVGAEVATARQRVEILQRRLIEASGRRDVVLDQARSSRTEEERRSLQDDSLEAALAMRWRATDKQGVLD